MAKETLAEQLQRLKVNAETENERMAMAMAFSDFIQARTDPDVGLWEFYDARRNTYSLRARAFIRILENTKRNVIG